MTNDITSLALVPEKNFALFTVDEHGDEQRLDDVAAVESTEFFSITRFVTEGSNLSSVISAGDATVVLRIYQTTDLFHDFVYRLIKLVGAGTILNTTSTNPMVIKYVYEYEFIEERKM